MVERTYTPSSIRPPFTPEVINLDAYPHGALLRLCDRLGRAILEMEASVERTADQTIEGRRMKELTL